MPKTLHYDFLNDKSLVGIAGPLLTCVRSGVGATYRDSAGVRQAAAANIPRFDHDALGVSLGLYSEKERTNLFLNSNAPVTQDVTTTAQEYTVSVEGPGTVTLSGTGSGVASEGSPVTVSASAGTLTLTVAGGPDWVQCEAGAFESSMIETAGSIVTREKEDIMGVITSQYSQGAGSWYCQAGHRSNDTSDFMFQISDNSNSDRIGIGSNSNGRGTLALRALNVNGAAAATFADEWPNDGTLTRVALGYDALAGNMAIWWEGVQDGVTGDTVDSPANITDLNLGSQWNEDNQLDGHIAEIRYYNERLSDEALEDMSNGIFPPEGGRNTHIAVTRRTAKQMRPKQRMAKPKASLREML